MKTCYKVTGAFVAGFAASVFFNKLLDKGDFGKKITDLVPQIGFWWNNGNILNGENVPPEVGWAGIILFVAILAIIIFRVKLKRPKRED